jgi:hypothetical protein
MTVATAAQPGQKGRHPRFVAGRADLTADSKERFDKRRNFPGLGLQTKR